MIPTIDTTGGRRSLRRRSMEIAIVLGVSTTVGYGTLYYAFGVVARDMASDTGFSLTTVYGLFSLGMFVSGLVAARAGSLFDRFDPASVMAAGSLAAALALGLWAALPGRWPFAVMVVAVQAISMLVLYEAAFVAAAFYVPASARRTITGITLIAGFASTIFWPLTAWLLRFWSWREIYLMFAVLHVLFCFLPHLWLARRPERRMAGNGTDGEPGLIEPRLADARRRRSALILSILGFAANAFVISSVHLHLIGLLEAIGLAASAAIIGALIGPSQVAGRLIEFILAERLSILAVTIFSALALPLALLVLVWTAPWTVGAILFAVLFGLGQGLSYIARGVFPLELFGTRGYGALSGRINGARLIASAAAPFVTAAIFEQRGVMLAIAAIVVAGLASVAAFLAIVPLTTESTGEKPPR